VGRELALNLGCHEASDSIIRGSGQDADSQRGFLALGFFADSVEHELAAHVRYAPVFSFLKVIQQRREAPPFEKSRGAENES
jgi:hypothetical protein